MSGGWIATGLTQDLPIGTVMAVAWQGVDLAVWRSATGRLSAWKDRCPHRGMRLSHGFVRGETLACIYHGWVYGSTGQCQHIPAHPALTPPATIRATAFACREAGGVIWLAPEDIKTPPPALGPVVPLRTLTLNCPPDRMGTIEPALTGADILRGMVQIGGRDVALCLLVQPLADATRIHALCDAGADKIAVSRWLEDLRRRAEMGDAA